ncbi:MAG: hypothetical protein DWI02_08445 [Planctomycetota bacterium]|nr:MAG: hypothetical protein DWI02_08445 [Planctomycetota bacterium]
MRYVPKTANSGSMNRLPAFYLALISKKSDLRSQIQLSLADLMRVIRHIRGETSSGFPNLAWTDRLRQSIFVRELKNRRGLFDIEKPIEISFGIRLEDFTGC